MKLCGNQKNFIGGCKLLLYPVLKLKGKDKQDIFIQTFTITYFTRFKFFF